MKKTIICFLTILLFACNQSKQNNANNNSPNNSAGESTTKEKTDQDEITKSNKVYPWVDKLNIRDQASTKGKSIASVNSGDALELIDSKSGKMETLVLRSVAYEDYWFKVRTSDGEEGWVFGGAVKQENETKGNDPMTKEAFDFPYFGRFDVSGWGKTGPTDVSESEEMDESLVSYIKGDEILKIVTWDMGDMGYGYRYQIQDGKEEDLILKEREISFSPGFDQSNTLSEIVKDFTQNPPMQYSRIQKVNVSRHDLKPFPLMALGSWKEEMLDAENDMFLLFLLWPNEDMGISMETAEKEDLIDIEKRAAKNWKIHSHENHKLFLKSTNPELPTAEELVFNFFQYNTSSDGVLVAISRWGRNHQSSKLSAMRYNRGKQSLKKINAPDFDPNDFVSPEDKLPANYEARPIFYFRDKHIIEVTLYTWMDVAFEDRKIINQVFFDWDGNDFNKRIEKIKEE